MRKGLKASDETRKKLSLFRSTCIKPIEFIINEKGCHVCTSHAKPKNGYPVICRNKKSITIARFLYIEKHGAIPEGMCLCHSCDNRDCINVDHLFLGTYKENSEDCVNKGRSTIGEKNSHAVITSDQVKEIRAHTYYKGLYRDLSKIYGVSSEQISRIYKKILWKHIP